MKSGLLIVALANALSGCTGSNQGNKVAVLSPALVQGYTVTNDARATNGQEGIKAGDALVITFTNLPSSNSFSSFRRSRSFQAQLGPVPALPAFDQRVRDDGTITLINNRVFRAAGKGTGDLEKEIRDYYVPEYFRDLTVMVRLTSGSFVYVSGEFRKPGRYAWTNGMKLNDAIEMAGGFSEYASPSRTKVIPSDGTSERYRLRGDWVRTNNPALKAEDRIHNPRTLL